MKRNKYTVREIGRVINKYLSYQRKEARKQKQQRRALYN